MNRSKAATVALWIGTVLFAALFAFSGAGKLAGKFVEGFVHYGYPGWFSYVIGVVELGGAVALLIRPVAALGAAALGVVMVGAIPTHLLNGEAPKAFGPLAFLVLLSVIGWARRSDLFFRHERPRELGRAGGAA
jgi:uncharacterized membrane protein YphA (DoxX/SURF4 family)